MPSFLAFQLAKTGKNISPFIMRTLLALHPLLLALRLTPLAKYPCRSVPWISCDVTQRLRPVRVAFFRGPDGELIELLEDKTGST
jgi:catechol 2,3-dioxygenase-like lactoylglutathione lyase family enzyme